MGGPLLGEPSDQGRFRKDQGHAGRTHEDGRLRANVYRVRRRQYYSREYEGLRFSDHDKHGLWPHGSNNDLTDRCKGHDAFREGISQYRRARSRVNILDDPSNGVWLFRLASIQAYFVTVAIRTSLRPRPNHPRRQNRVQRLAESVSP